MMADVYIRASSSLEIPDNVTLPQFMLNGQHRLRPDRLEVPCFIDDITGQKISFDEVKNDTYTLARILRSSYDIGDNDVVLIASPNHSAFPIVFWAVLLLGGAVSCSNPQLSAGELRAQLKDAKASLIIGHSINISTVLSAAVGVGLPTNRVILIDEVTGAQRGPQSQIVNIHSLMGLGLQQEGDFEERILKPGEGKRKVALLAWSSGTTGKPKPVAISHYALIANIIQMAAHNRADEMHPPYSSQGFQPGDVALGVLPFYHVAGLVLNLHFIFFCAMPLVIIEKYRFLGLLHSIVRHRITHLILVPPMALDLCKHPSIKDYNLKTVKHLIIGAAPVPKEIQVQLYDLFPTAQIGQAYGLTEMTATLAMIAGTQARGPLGSGGRLLPGVQARVIRQDGTIADYGEEGELLVKAPSIALGYPNDRLATKDTFLNGWLRTGDEVFLSEDNEIFVVDRIKELLKVKGYQVAPSELEGCLLAHPDIIDCCVVGVKDERSGELPYAYVVLTQPAQDRSRSSARGDCRIRNSIAKHVADRLTSYKHPKGGIEFIEQIPKSASGKLLRRVLRDRAHETRLSQTSFRARL